MCTALASGAPCSVPVKLGHLPRRTCSACNAMVGPWSDGSAVSSQRMWPGWGRASCCQGFSLRASASFWERGGFAGLGMWRVQVVQSEQHMICRWTASGGKGGPSGHGGSWQRRTAVSGSSPQLTLKKGAPGDQVWDLLCVQLASYLEGPLMWMMPLHLHVNQKSDYDMMKPRSGK